MKKIVINTCFGGFGLSDEAMLLFAKKKGIEVYPEKSSWGNSSIFFTEKGVGENRDCLWIRDFERDDPSLIEVVEELGERSYGQYAELSIVEIPDGVSWHISEYDGSEHIAEDHRIWY